MIAGALAQRAAHPHEMVRHSPEEELGHMNESGLTRLQKIQFYVASGARSIISGLVKSAFIKYYTDYIGLDPKWMGIVYVIYSIWAAINDPILGLWMDKRPYREGIGKYRPAFLRAMPAWILITVAFPWASPSWSQLGISIYLFLALTLWETASTVFGIAYGAIATNLFLTTAERAEVEVIDNYVGALTIFGSSIPIMILSMDVSHNVMLLFFAIATIAAGLIMAISIPVVREREGFYKDEVVESLSLKEFLATTVELLKNRAFLTYFLTFFVWQSLASNYLFGMSYFYDNVLLSKGLWTGLPDILIGIMGLVLFPFIAVWIRRMGSKRVLQRMIIWTMVGYLLLTFVPATRGDALNTVRILGLDVPAEASYWLATGAYFVVYVGFSAVYTANGPIGKRLVDYLEIKTGQRRPGTISGVRGVLMTPSSSVLIFFYTQIISAFGYDGATKVQDLRAQWGIRIATGLLPVIMVLIGMVFFSRYPIDKETEDWVEAETLVRHGAASQEAGG
jgi:GPH family glycoside/pentoside/hexuronide:cation symporter